MMNTEKLLSSQEITSVCSILRANTSPLKDKVAWTSKPSRHIYRGVIGGFILGLAIASRVAYDNLLGVSGWIVIVAGTIVGSLMGSLAGAFFTDRARADRQQRAQYVADHFTRTTGGKDILAVTQSEVDGWMKKELVRPT